MDHIFSIESNRPYTVHQRAGVMEVGECKIHLKVEQELVDAVIAALCEAHTLTPDQFQTKLVIREGKEAGRGTIALAVMPASAQQAGPMSAKLREFCDNELVRQLEAVHRRSQQIAAGIVPTDGERRQVEASGFEASTPLERALVAGSGERVPSEAGQRARDALAEQLLARLGGKTLPPILISAQGAGEQIGARLINRPQRRPEPPTTVVLFGHVNGLSLDPAVVEVIADEDPKEEPRARHKLNYRFEAHLEDMFQLLKLGARARVRFDVERTAEAGAGSRRTSDALLSFRRLDGPAELPLAA